MSGTARKGRMHRAARAGAGLGLATGMAALTVGALAVPASAATGARNPAAPPRPVLAAYYPTSTSVVYGKNHQAVLRISGVAAGGGAVTSLTIRYPGHAVAVPVVRGRSVYQTTVTGLANGTSYRFTATVCNTAKRCTASAPISFVPHGLPVPPAPVPALDGAQVTFSWGTVDLDASEFAVDACTVRIEGDPVPEESIEPVAADPAQPGTTTFTGVPGTTYVARYLCSVGGGRVTAVTSSAPVTVA